MDYIFITADKLQNLNKDEGDIEFKYTSSEPVNFFEASFSVQVEYDINLKNGCSIDSSDKVELKPFIVYDMIKKLELKLNNQMMCENNNLYDFIRFTQIFEASNRDQIYGFKKEAIKNTPSKTKVVYNIPLKFLFSEFKGMNHVMEGTFFIKTVFNKIKNIVVENEHILDIKYEILNFDLKIPIHLRVEEELIKPKDTIIFRRNFMNKFDVSYAIKAGKADVPISSCADKPLVFIGYFTDANNKIVKGCKSFQLMINNSLYPVYDFKVENGYEHLYEMYLRYIDYVEGYDLLESHQKPLNVLSFSDFCSEPKFFFILPKLTSKNGMYDIKVKMTLDKVGNKIQDLNYLYFYSE